MKNKKYILPEEVSQQIVAEKKSPYGLRTYISLFSSAGVGCYGFNPNRSLGFLCVVRQREIL